MTINSNMSQTFSSLSSNVKVAKNIQATMNGYVNEEAKKINEILIDHLTKATEENKSFMVPSSHISDKYYREDSPYYIHGLTKEERQAAYENEVSCLIYGVEHSSLFYTDPALRSVDKSSLYGDVDVAQRKAFDRQKVNEQFQSLLDKSNISIPKDTKLTFTIDPNDYKVTVKGMDDPSLTKLLEDNAQELFHHIILSEASDMSSTQFSKEKNEKFSLIGTIRNETGYNLRDLELKNGKFVTPDGADLFELYKQKVRADKSIPDFAKALVIDGTAESLSKLEKGGFNALPDLILSIDYENGSFYDVGQSENFGSGKTDWIGALKASKPKLITSPVAQEEPFDGQKIIEQFQSLLAKSNIQIPKDTKLSFGFDKNGYKLDVEGVDNPDLVMSLKELFIRMLLSEPSDGGTQSKEKNKAGYMDTYA